MLYLSASYKKNKQVGNESFLYCFSRAVMAGILELVFGVSAPFVFFLWVIDVPMFQSL